MTRAAADVGAGLAPARRARPIAAGERIHVVGAAGAGASAAALLATWAGGEVDGCDPGGVRRVPAPARLAVTKALTAIDPGNAELEAARELGIPIEAWQQVVADAAAGRRMVGVAGT